MKKLLLLNTLLVLVLALISGCQTYETEHNYIEVIGEHEQQMPDAGFKLNLSYNGPMANREKFEKWVDSVQLKVPGMVKTNENIYLNQMPEERDIRVKPEAYQTSINYILNAPDNKLYNSITDDLLRRGIPFNINVMGSYMDPAIESAIRKDLMQKALEDAKDKLAFLSGEGKTFEIVSIEELDKNVPYGPDYYDFNRRMVSRVKVKAKLNNQ